MAGFCPNCGKPAGDDAIFCVQCGTNIGEATAAALAGRTRGITPGGTTPATTTAPTISPSPPIEATAAESAAVPATSAVSKGSGCAKEILILVLVFAFLVVAGVGIAIYLAHGTR